MNFAKEEVDFTPPSQDDEIITSLTHAGRMSSQFNSMERSISSSVLRFSFRHILKTLISVGKLLPT
eukprot:CCRYP_005286-RA/>CCRYP_005286-RA protein AED:0.47 eAED:0.51 QI:0/0/0/1/0/0/2/0/65